MDETANVQIVRAILNAYVSKDRDLAERLIAPDFHFTSPLDNRLDRATYFERCWPNSEHTAGFTFINLAPFADRVLVTYEGRTDAGRVFRNSEILTVQNGQITDVEVYFGWTLPHEAPPGGFVEAAE